METKASLWGVFVDIIETIVVAAAIFVIVYLFLLQPHQVKGGSMEPNYHDGEYILTDKVSYRFSQPKRGDIIIFKSPTNTDLDFIKRIIALPGEEIEVKEGKITIFNDQYKDGFVLEEHYNTNKPTTVEKDGQGYLIEGVKKKVNAGSYIVFGDNRSQSFDSRSWGEVPKGNIIGKAWLRYWPLNRFGFVKHENYKN
ncbi:MAG: signal peptidase I [Candidatus Woykebacteria bacterium RIFCSPHIGHO2_12_FULL_45_10]|uniref:Signal peptidase I n=1 Tax=Candidatus Woykebacteria bacterium RIFCSPHIGHO2_12_FULL_45_10 TaxID=1802603 RepID=A0A1G1WQQ8_9BACT|nr:MAG: signal peptidase I [Candidatus Woykebacteria bacterium RIFCSPHIGHO2_12_FULL_45_10]